MPASLLRLACVVLLPLLAAAVHAQAVVPSTLEPWRGWVLKDQQFRSCPLLAGRSGAQGEADYLCRWPGTLALDARSDGVDFAQRWRIDAEGWIALPGGDGYWPQAVTLDGQPAIVVDRDGPALWLAAGNHEIRGRIPWQERPQTLRVPASIGLVTLAVDGRPVAPLQRNGAELSLGRSAGSTPAADSIELRVHRLLADGVPALLITRIQLQVSGQAREEVFGPVLPPGFLPTALSDAWPARLDQDGRLHVLVQPGAETLTLQARADAPLVKARAPAAAAPWPQREIWSYAADPAARISVASAATAVDPRQNGVPDEWLDSPAFALAAGDEIRIEQRSRGLAEDEGNRLRLQREMWLDFDGGGWFAHDRVAGDMQRRWRLDLVAPFTLERASDGDGSALLVTQGGGSGLSGVEWRTPAVALDAGLRIAGAGARLPVTGWQDSFEHVHTVLHLPNGYRLLAAPGADRADGSWLSRWTLLDVFLAALLVLVAWRVAGVAGGMLACAYLLLGYQEDGAPVWTLLAALVLTLIARALPSGQLARVAQWLQRGALVVLALVALPFAAAQLRYALHPQLEPTGVVAPQGAGEPASAELADAEVAGAAVGRQRNAAGAQRPLPAPASAPTSMALESVTVTGTRNESTAGIEVARNDPAAVMQTGSGEPAWQLGHRYQLDWSGPILPTQQVRLLIAAPWLVRPLRVVLVALLALLLVLSLRPRPPRAPGRGARALLGALALAPGLLLPGAPAQAQAFPSDALLSELRARLTEVPKCAPACALAASAEVSARGDRIDVVLQVNAAERVAVPLPADEQGLTLRSLRVDGVAQDAFARNGNRIWTALPRGVHRIELAFDASGDQVALAFALQPQRVRFSGEAWEASGLIDERLQTETLSLARARASQGGDEAMSRGASQQFAPFVRVTRTLALGMDWNLVTEVERIAPEQGGFSTSVPVLAGEHVTSAGRKVSDGRIAVALGDDDDYVHWSSTLDKGASLQLTAPALDARAEVWRVVVGPMWHVEFAGVPVLAADAGASERPRRFEFRPLPGETLTLTVTRPAALPGASVAIDAVNLEQELGQRASTSTLALTLRASQGGEHLITLPPGAEVLGVSRDGSSLNLRPREGKLSLPLVPGAQLFQIRWREPTPLGSVATSPHVALGLPAANIALSQSLPHDRWLLASSGPATGPAVLYWSELLAMLLVALALARLPWSPLRFWQWALLGVGFSTWSWPALLVVAAWLFALAWRKRGPLPRSATGFNLAQVGLVLLSVYALLCVFESIRHGLLGRPDMHVVGNGSSQHQLVWFADRSTDLLPLAKAFTLPLWSYQLAMLLWALWLAAALVRWLREGFAAWTQGGYWRRRPKPLVEVPSEPPPPPP